MRSDGGGDNSNHIVIISMALIVTFLLISRIVSADKPSNSGPPVYVQTGPPIFPLQQQEQQQLANQLDLNLVPPPPPFPPGSGEGGNPPPILPPTFGDSGSCEKPPLLQDLDVQRVRDSNTLKAFGDVLLSVHGPLVRRSRLSHFLFPSWIQVSLGRLRPQR